MSPMRAACLLLAALLPAGCDFDFGGGGGGGGGPSLGSLSLFIWDQRTVPCLPVVGCSAELRVDGAGQATWTVDGSARSATLSGNDFLRFTSVVAAASTVEALRDPTPCAVVPSAVIVVQVELVGGVPAAKEIAGCTDVLSSAPDPRYQAIADEVERIRAAYFR